MLKGCTGCIRRRARCKNEPQGRRIDLAVGSERGGVARAGESCQVAVACGASGVHHLIDVGLGRIGQERQLPGACMRIQPQRSIAARGQRCIPMSRMGVQGLARVHVAACIQSGRVHVRVKVGGGVGVGVE